METTYVISEDVRQKIIAYIKKNQPYWYWDRNDSLSLAQINTIVTENDGYNSVMDEIWNNCVDYLYELEVELIKEAIKDLSTEDQLSLFPTDWNVTEVNNRNINELANEIYEDFMDYIEIDMQFEQLINRSNPEVFFYSTGLELNGFGYLKEDIKAVKKFLKIPMKETKWDASIKEAVANASYGGTLCIAFCSVIENWMYDETPPTTITFHSPMLVIPNHGNGSGWHADLPGFEFTLPFLKSNLYLDNAVKYSYTNDVCGMYNNWCDCTSFSVGYKTIKRKIGKSRIAEHMEREAKYNATFKAGGCTFGDMDITRHRRTPYINEIPCGNRCLDCGTFWID